MKTVTFDSTTNPDDPVILRAQHSGWQVAFASVSAREAVGTPFESLHLSMERLPEIAVFDETRWDEGRWADDSSISRIEKILTIVSNGSFPKDRTTLSKGQKHQFRDCLILEAHAAARRSVFVTDDFKAFINDGRRERLEALLGTRILKRIEFEAELGKDGGGA